MNTANRRASVVERAQRVSAERRDEPIPLNDLLLQLENKLDEMEERFPDGQSASADVWERLDYAMLNLKIVTLQGEIEDRHDEPLPRHLAVIRGGAS